MRLVLRNLGAKNLFGRPILHGLDLNVPAGAWYMVLGDNSSGKSTLVKILAGLYPQVEGEIWLENRLVKPDRPETAISAGFSFLFQDEINILPLSIAENIFLKNEGSRFFLQRKQLYHKARSFLQAVELAVDPRKSARDLSRDDQVLVLLARAFATRPRILVIDEALMNLSRVHVKKLTHSLMDYRAAGGSILYLSSRPDQMVHLADYVGILEEGKMTHQLTAGQIQSDPELIMRLYVKGGQPFHRVRGNLSDLGDAVLQAFFKSSEILASEYELSDILEFLAERACQLTDARACAIKMIEEESGKVGDMVGYSRDWEKIPDIESGYEQKALDRGQPWWLHDENQLRSLFHEHTPLVGSIAWVPIRIRGKNAGVIQLFFEDPDITPDMEMIKTFANQTALAIENTRLLGLSALLQEAHHRIKNNLQSIISLLALQMEKQSSPEAVQALSQSINRVKAIATVHDLLSRDQKAGSYLNICQIIQKLVDWYAVRLGESGVTLEFSGKDLFLPYRKATPVALAVNELLTNCLQHAFPHGKKGIVTITVWENNKKIMLRVKDNGKGTGKTDIDAFRAEGHLGLWLVKTLVTADLSGNFTLTEREGTEAVISIPGQ